jgi:membrane-associated phospholipid phosphatase
LIIAFVICTMFCRIATGNHYLSDVCGAVLIQLACYTFSYFLINKVGKLNTQIT